MTGRSTPIGASSLQVRGMAPPTVNGSLPRRRDFRRHIVRDVFTPGSQGHTVLAVLDFLGYADLHALLLGNEVMITPWRRGTRLINEWILYCPALTWPNRLGRAMLCTP